MWQYGIKTPSKLSKFTSRTLNLIKSDDLFGLCCQVNNFLTLGALANVYNRNKQLVNFATLANVYNT